MALLPEDASCAIHAEVTTILDGRRYTTMSCGHCALATA